MKLTLIILTLIVLIILIVIYKNYKKEKYVPISDDVAVNVLLPTLDLQDLIKYQKSDPESDNIIKKFINGYLKLEGLDLCSLRTTKYFTKMMPEIKTIYYPKLTKESKPIFDLENIKNWSLELVEKAFQNLDPKLNFLKKIEDEWLIYDDFMNLDKNVMDTSLKNRLNLKESFSYWVHLEPGDYGFHEFKVFIKNGVFPQLHSYFEKKVNEVEEWDEKYTLPKEYLFNNILVDFKEEIESPIDLPITDYEDGKVYTFMIFLNFFPPLLGYSTYINYLEGLEEWKETKRELDDIFSDSDSDEEKEP